MDKDKDGLISYDEFMTETKDDNFAKDEDWKPLVDEDQYTEDELKNYEKEMELEEGKVSNFFMHFQLVSN